jgi:hypothetical protein
VKENCVVAFASCVVVIEDIHEYPGPMINAVTAENAITRNNFLLENEFVISSYLSPYTTVYYSWWNCILGDPWVIQFVVEEK